MKRREFLERLFAKAIVVLLAPYCPDIVAADSKQLDSRESEMIRAVATEFRRISPKLSTRQHIRRRFKPLFTGEKRESSRKFLQELIDHDYQAGRMFEFNGWLLAESEGQLSVWITLFSPAFSEDSNSIAIAGPSS